MLYAKIVFGLPIDGPFDYIVPAPYVKKIKPGARVWVNFGHKKMLGFVVGLSKKSSIKNLKSILELIDDTPVAGRNLLVLTKQLSEYYCCSWGEAIETSLPEKLRKGKKIQDSLSDHESLSEDSQCINKVNAAQIKLIFDLDGEARWDIYLKSITDALSIKKSVIFLFSDINSVLTGRQIISARLGITPFVLYRKQPNELEEWLKLKNIPFGIALGTRSSIFAPLSNLGLVIVDEEQDSVYKQDQVPHYNAREVAVMRANIEKSKVILGSTSPSLESFYLTTRPAPKRKELFSKKSGIEYIFIPPRKGLAEVKIIDTRHQPFNFKSGNTILTRYLEDAIYTAVNAKGKTLLFFNRKGFATLAVCLHCGVILRCPRCNINLVFHFKENAVNCHYCGYKTQAPKICPSCNAGYIRYSGMGVEKIESELSRIFPAARIKSLENLEECRIDEADIFISTQSILKGNKFYSANNTLNANAQVPKEGAENRERGGRFDLIGVLGLDNSLNRVDFRSSERVFGQLCGLLGLGGGRIIIQTALTGHHCFQAMESSEFEFFYNTELKQRKELKFPPFSHLGLVKLRSINESKAETASRACFEHLSKYSSKSIVVISVNPSNPSKLRGKFYWQILIKAYSASSIAKFLKKHLKGFSHSGIIVTVDIDPL